MSGRPVWLASASLRDWRGEIVLTGKMAGRDRARLMDVIAEVLDGVGMPEHERCFRMNVTICVHRAVSPSEEAKLTDDEWKKAPAIHLAGGPVELLWARGVQETDSVRPCRNMGKEWISDRIWLPQDCGRCAPCRARATIAAGVEAQIAAAGGAR